MGARARVPGTRAPRPAGSGSSGGGSEACAAGAGGILRGSTVRARVCVCGGLGGLCARPCIRVRAGPRESEGNNAPGAPPSGLPARPVAPRGRMQFSRPWPRCSSLQPLGRRVGFDSSPAPPEAVPVAGATQARPLGPAPEVVGLGSERSPHSGRHYSAAVPATSHFFSSFIFSLFFVNKTFSFIVT